MANSLTLSASEPPSKAFRYRGVRWPWYLLGAALIAAAFAELAGDRAVQAPPPESATHVQAAGRFTGEFVDGVPVYRLQTVTVVADREAEIARMHRDDTPPRARQTRG